MDITLGTKVRDKITGFEGIATGRATYITGCDQICITPQAEGGDFKSSHWVDDARVETIPGVGIEQDAVQGDDNGGPREEEAPKY